jgi:thioredoxin 1
MPLSTVVTLTKTNFLAEVLLCSTPILVYFWAEWCGPCKEIGPVLDELADQYGNRVKIGRVNIDQQPALAAEYGVRAVPTLVLMRQGQVTREFVGLRTTRDLQDSFERVIA